MTAARQLLPLILLLTSLAGAAGASPSICKSVWATKVSLPEGVREAIHGNTDFPVIPLSIFLSAHYADLDREIDGLLGKTRDELNSDLQLKLGRLNEINSRLFDNVEKIRSTISPTGLKKLLTQREFAMARVSDLIHEASFCRGRGQVCVKDVKVDLQTLLTYHDRLKEFAYKLEGELSELNALIKHYGSADMSVQGALGRQREALNVATVSLQAQLSLHRKFVDEVISAIDTFDNKLRGSVRMLMVSAPGRGDYESELQSLHDGSSFTFEKGLENFARGLTVYVPIQDHFRTATITDLAPDSKITVTLPKKSRLAKSSILDIAADAVLLSGCHFGVCTGDQIRLPSGLRVRRGVLHNEMKPSTICGTTIVLGYNPITHEFALIDSRFQDELGKALVKHDTIWVSAPDLALLMRGETPSDLRDHGTGAESGSLTTDEHVIFIRAEKLFFGYATKGQVRSVEGDVAELKSGSKNAKITTTNIARIGCFGGFCSGQLVTNNDPKDARMYRVLGYNHSRDAYLVEHLTGPDNFRDRSRLHSLPVDYGLAEAEWVKADQMIRVID